MARPKKNNADYFPHDSGMRNDRKVKALRSKFGHVGYSVYVMIIESLTDADFFILDFNEIAIELLAGDFDVESKKLCEIVDYCLLLGLIQSCSGRATIWSDRHKNNFISLLGKRKRDRKGVIDSENLVIDSENPQSKVKESKEDTTTTPQQLYDVNKFPPTYVDHVSKFMDYHLQNNPKMAVEKTASNLFKQVDSFDKLIRLDGFSLDDVVATLRFAVIDSFWCDQVYSIRSLRRKSDNDMTKFKNIYNKMNSKHKSSSSKHQSNNNLMEMLNGIESYESKQIAGIDSGEMLIEDVSTFPK